LPDKGVFVTQKLSAGASSSCFLRIYPVVWAIADKLGGARRLASFLNGSHIMLLKCIHHISLISHRAHPDISI